MTADLEKSTPPYVSYSTFTAFLQSMSGTAVPPQIDRSMMSKIAGITQTQLLACLRFLGLIDAEDRSTDYLEQLVKSCRDGNFSDVLRPILIEAYADIVGGVDLTKATHQALKTAFQTVGGLNGDSLEKSVRFFLKAMKEAGFSLSPHFKNPRQTSPRGPRKSPGPQKTKTSGSPIQPPEIEHSKQATDQTQSSGLIKLPIYLPGKPTGHLLIPEDLDEADCEMIETFLRGYAKRRNTKN